MRVVKATVGGRDLVVSQLGFGCARLWGGIERRHTFRMLESAYRIGIRHFDTAPSYGHGQSENLLGEVFAGITDVTFMTKVGIPRPTGAPSFVSVLRRLATRHVLNHAPGLKRRLLVSAQGRAPSEVEQPRQVLERDVVLRSLDDSLKRLRRDRIDFYSIHEPDQYVIDDGLLTMFDQLKASGRISAHGLAWGRSVSTVPAGWDVIQACYAPQTRRDGRLRFFHGVLRFSQTDAPARLAAAIQDEPDAVFIISASEPHRLTDLSERLALDG
jgi:aryl-alcohol dehydrogenase-like predicted oxidoreductase